MIIWLYAGFNAFRAYVSNKFYAKFFQYLTRIIPPRYYISFIESEFMAGGVNKIRLERKTQIYELDKTAEIELENIKKETLELLNKETVPSVENAKKCAKCAYYSYCKI